MKNINIKKTLKSKSHIVCPHCMNILDNVEITSLKKLYKEKYDFNYQTSCDECKKLLKFFIFNDSIYIKRINKFNDNLERLFNFKVTLTSSKQSGNIEYSAVFLAKNQFELYKKLKMFSENFEEVLKIEYLDKDNNWIEYEHNYKIIYEIYDFINNTKNKEVNMIMILKKFKGFKQDFIYDRVFDLLEMDLIKTIDKSECPNCHHLDDFKENDFKQRCSRCKSCYISDNLEECFRIIN